MLDRALRSVSAQTLTPAAVSVAVDVDRAGAWGTRQRALDAVRTPLAAFLDSDDEMLPHHLEHLLACMEETRADYVFSWFHVVGGTDPFPHFFGQPWDNNHPHQTTITVLVRTELAKEVGFHKPVEGELVAGQRFGEDYAFTLGCMEAGAKIAHLPEISWRYHHHGTNSSGLPSRW